MHIGTGNYPSHGAALRGFRVVTCSPAIARDVVNLFHFLTGHSTNPISVALLLAPLTIRPRLIELIRPRPMSESRSTQRQKSAASVAPSHRFTESASGPLAVRSFQEYTENADTLGFFPARP